MIAAEHFTPPSWWPIPALYVLRGGAVVEGDCEGPIDTPSALTSRPEGWDYLGELLHTPLRGAEFPPGEPLDCDGPEVTAAHTHPQRLMILLAVAQEAVERAERSGSVDSLEGHALACERALDAWDADAQAGRVEAPWPEVRASVQRCGDAVLSLQQREK